MLAARHNDDDDDYLFICYLSSCDKVKLFVFNILVFVNFHSSTFVCINCVVYCRSGTLIYILEKYPFPHSCYHISYRNLEGSTSLLAPQH